MKGRYKFKRCSVQVTEGIKEEFKEVCVAKGHQMRYVMEKIMREFIDKHNKENKKK